MPCCATAPRELPIHLVATPDAAMVTFPGACPLLTAPQRFTLRSVPLLNSVPCITAGSSLHAVPCLPPSSSPGCRSSDGEGGVGAASRCLRHCGVRCRQQAGGPILPWASKVGFTCERSPSTRGGVGLCSATSPRRCRLLALSPQDASCSALCRCPHRSVVVEPQRACSLLTASKPFPRERMVACEAHLQLYATSKIRSENVTSRLPLTPISVDNT